MLKKIVIILVLLAIVASAVMYFINKKENLAEGQQTAVELTPEESQAIELLNEEIIRDQCVVYADEDNVKDEELEEYLNSCVEQLKAEATMIEPAKDIKNDEEILKQCTVYAKQDAVKEEKLDEYMDLCIEQLRAEATMIDPEPEEALIKEQVNIKEEKNKNNIEVVDTKKEQKEISIEKDKTLK